MVESTMGALNAHVTMDVAIPTVIWGWIITMNMWAKSIGTGIILVGAYIYKKHKNQTGSLNISMPIISIIFIHIFLLFTVIDLHQMFRFWHIFFHPHWTSAITVGAWAATAFVGVLFLMAYASILKKDEALFEKMMWLAVILALPVTLYTATIMGESTARELWQTPAEMVQMLAAAGLAGSATLLIIGRKFNEEIKKDLALVLFASAFISFMVYMSEYFFGHMKAEEVAAVISYVRGGEYGGLFWIGQFMAFIIPMVLVFVTLKNKAQTLLLPASIIALIGLWISKHVWLIIPQLLPMS
ncbi:MAG: polysulfide reductase NrfD [Campylobacterales bacterium]|nr:polysulfide reductase NrfD [Campylobacterales bacterium]